MEVCPRVQMRPRTQYRGDRALAMVEYPHRRVATSTMPKCGCSRWMWEVVIWWEEGGWLCEHRCELVPALSPTRAD